MVKVRKRQAVIRNGKMKISAASKTCDKSEFWVWPWLQLSAIYLEFQAWF